MPLKVNKKVVRVNPNPVKEGNLVQTGGSVMSLFESAKIPFLTLQANQFKWPKTLLVVKADRIPEYIKNEETGWDLKDSQGNKTKTGNYFVRLDVADGDNAQMIVDGGGVIDGLTSVECVIHKDIPLQNFVINETLIELVKPNVMLGFGGQSANRIKLIAEDYKEV